MARPEQRWKLRVISAARRRVRAMAPAPALGWAAARPVPAEGTIEQPVRVSQDSLDNGIVDVRVSSDGTLTITRDGVIVEGVGRLVDGGDAGDSYNYGPPAHDTVVDAPIAVNAVTLAGGPVVGEINVKRRYRWPAGLSDDHRARSGRTVETDVEMRVELRAGEPFVRLTLELDNQADDHRLRLHVPLVRAADHSSAAGQYTVVERGLTAESGHGEVPLATFPAYGWVDAGGVTALLDQVTEYELVDGTELALTCLRSIGMISRNDNPYREDPAGPERPMPAAQMRGRQQVRLGILVHAGDWHAADVPAAAELYAHEFVVARGTRGIADGGVTDTAGLSIGGAGVVMTALQQRGEWLELRIVAEHPASTVARIGAGLFAAREVDLLGREVGSLDVSSDGWLSLPMEPWQIRTIQVRR